MFGGVLVIDDMKRATAIWAYTLSMEKVLRDYIERGILDEGLFSRFEGEMSKQIHLYDVPGAHLSYIGEVLIDPYRNKDMYCSVSLTELARQKNPTNPSYVIQAWLRDYKTIEFLRLWEQQSNPEFENQACDKLIDQMKNTTFTLTPKQWIEQTKAIGLKSKQGKGGGTIAHADIACEFHMWLDPKFKMDVVKEFRAGLIQS